MQTSPQLGLHRAQFRLKPLAHRLPQYREFSVAARFFGGARTDLDGLPALPAALEEQLGLKLESRRGPFQVLVIDSVQQPTEN